MARFPVSGYNATALTTGTASTSVVLITCTTGRMYWLRGLLVAPNSTAGPVCILDQSGGATVTGTTAARVTVELPLTASGQVPTIYNFSAPGIKFTSGYCSAIMQNSGAVAIGAISAWGYEE